MALRLVPTTEHLHAFVRRWRCEHTDVNHRAVCQRGRWIFVCNCGEPGYFIEDR